MVNEELLKQLVQIDSAPGDERRISEFLRARYEKLADEIVYDNLGSIYAVKRSKTPNAPHVMVSGHMDESGFIVKKLREDGLLDVLVLGDIVQESLVGTAVRITTTDNRTVEGTLLSVTEKTAALTKKGVGLVDCGFKNEEEADAAGLMIGDHVSLAAPMRQNAGSSRVIAKNWNGRFAPLAGLALLEAVKDEAFEFDLYVGCTVQETVGTRGIQTATNLVQPDLGLVLDTDQAFDYQSDTRDRIGVLGDGMVINFFDRTVLPNRALISALKALCRKEDIPFQLYYSLGGSDAAWINKLRTGSPTLFFNIAVRNMDTASQVADLNDVAAAQDALIAFVRQLTNDQIAAFKAENR